MATRPSFTDAEVAALAAAYAAACDSVPDIPLPARPATRVPSWLLRLRFPGALLTLVGAEISIFLHCAAAVLLFGGAAAVFVALIAINARWATARVLRRRNGGAR